jgi:hypothetical protein
MNAKIEQENADFLQVELGSIKSALKTANISNALPSQKTFARRAITRWKTLGCDLCQRPVHNKSGSKIKRPHG